MDSGSGLVGVVKDLPIVAPIGGMQNDSALPRSAIKAFPQDRPSFETVDEMKINNRVLIHSGPLAVPRQPAIGRCAASLQHPHLANPLWD